MAPMHAGPQSLAERRWQARLARISELRGRHPHAAPVLDFYSKVLQFQGDVARASTPEWKPDLPLREQIDVEFALGRLPALLVLAVESGPPKLAESAKELQRSDLSRRRAGFMSALSIASSPEDDVSWFFTRVCLQPLAEDIQFHIPADPNYTAALCPVCFAQPQAAVLRPEGEGAARSLLCSFCLREWLFRRLVCPYCGEENKDKLAHYTASEFPHVRVEACDTCKRYIKAVDLSIDGHAVSLVDEVALAVLDVWAAEQGYTKIVKNLMGL